MQPIAVDWTASFANKLLFVLLSSPVANDGFTTRIIPITLATIFIIWDIVISSFFGKTKNKQFLWEYNYNWSIQFYLDTVFIFYVGYKGSNNKTQGISYLQKDLRWNTSEYRSSCTNYVNICQWHMLYCEIGHNVRYGTKYWTYQ